MMVFAENNSGIKVYQIYTLVSIMFQTTLEDATVALNEKYDCKLPPLLDDMPYPIQITFEPYVYFKAFVSLDLDKKVLTIAPTLPS